MAPPGDSAPSDPLIGTLLLDRFRVIEPLGEGGMAVVFLAEHVTIHKKFAIKVLLPEHANKPVLVERFLQEARAASMIGHENVVEITDYGQAPNGSVFMVMELLEGEDLATTLERHGRVPWPRARAILLQICHALAAAHSKGIVHRDMKPENVFLVKRRGSSDFVKVLDFGIAKILGDVGIARSLTKTGSIFGTPEYMSPEQAESLQVDHRADIYSLGVLIYELLTGQVPFSADTYMALVTQHLYDPPPPPSQVAPDAGISPEVEALILKTLQKDREFRFQNMGELIRAIEAVGTGAGPVEVIAEHRVRPRTKGAATSYSGSHLGGEQLTRDEGAHAAPPASVANTRVIVGVGLGLGITALVITAILVKRADEPPLAPRDAPVSSELEPEAPPPDTPPEPPPSPTVSVVLTSNVDAEIVDLATGAVLGHTNEPSGITLERSEVPHEVLLRAEGYEELSVRLMPNSDIADRHVLAEVKRDKKKKKKKKTKHEDDPLSLLPIGK